jgi:hypothetical protein
MGVNADFSEIKEVSSGPKKPMLKAPSFMQRPCSVAFGFGGGMVTQKPGATTLYPPVVIALHIREPLYLLEHFNCLIHHHHCKSATTTTITTTTTVN